MCVVCKRFRLDLNRGKSSGVVKLDAVAVKKIVRNVVDYGLSVKDMARRYGVSERRVQQLCKEYRETGKIPELKKVGRKRKEYSDDIKLMIVRVAEKYKCGAVKVSKILREKYGLELDHNKVQEVLRVNGMAKEERDKRKRKKSWSNGSLYSTEFFLPFHTFLTFHLNHYL